MEAQAQIVCNKIALACKGFCHSAWVTREENSALGSDGKGHIFTRMDFTRLKAVQRPEALIEVFPSLEARRY